MPSWDTGDDTTGAVLRVVRQKKPLRNQWLKDVQETDIELIREEIGEKV